MTRGRLAVHGHFYQPSRVDPWTGQVPEEPSAAPFHDWNARVDAECYRPNAARSNLDPDLVGPRADARRRGSRARIRRRSRGSPRRPSGGNAIAQAFHHTILPLASAADRRTEIRWGLREFELRFGRRASGLWLPETAVDLATLRIAAAEGVESTILAPWQAADAIDSRRPYRVELGGGASIVVAFYDAGLSAAVSFEPEATSDADRFARDRVEPRLSSPAAATGDATARDATTGDETDGPPPLALIATDGELYGHHQQFRDLFLQRLVAPDASAAERRGFDVVSLADALVEADGRRHPTAKIVERTSWSCHHGVARWSAECPDAIDGRWKGPLRAALDRLAATIDVASERWFADAGPTLGPPRRVRRRGRRRDRAGRVRSRSPVPARRRRAGSRPRAPRGPALAARDVRERRLVLGRPHPPRDEADPAVGGAGRSHRRRGAGHGPGGPLRRRPRPLHLAVARPERREIYRVALAEVGQPGPG